MEWYSWLSKTSLEPSLIYEYGLTFTRNELQEEDIASFNHELLQSMGISVAKHRLEILKLARKELGGNPHAFSRLLWAIKKTKRRVTKGIGRWVSHNDTYSVALPEPRPYQPQWSGALSKKHMKSMEPRQDTLMLTNRSLKISKTSDGREQERMVSTNRSPKVAVTVDERVKEGSIVTNRSPKVSSPLDGRIRERAMLTSKSPKASGPLNGRISSPKDYNEGEADNDDAFDSIWATLFQDMRPN
ncbi:uncharacterized protein LOC131157877 [Malania oleifera]|uniref:uncharacterized protein LOC131157877 n=1 Tax=Malania oleifera TaxID=397392 RepID=UPI0025ADAF5E|nr:uncharacterized protein LOC131157877 [Malania oleifera]